MRVGSKKTFILSFGAALFQRSDGLRRQVTGKLQGEGDETAGVCYGAWRRQPDRSRERARMKPSTHEVFYRDENIVGGSDRSFGLVMAVVLVAVTSLNAWHGGHLWPWTGGVAALFLAAALLRPSVLNALNGVWLRFGLLLHGVVNPVVMAVVFYGAVLPTGMVMRALGKDPLRLKRQPDAESYWIVRDPPGPSPDSMREQF
jgi:hypothetical protein